MDEDAVMATAAVTACAPCRKNKRRCDKQLPSCGYCVRTGRACDYSDTATEAAELGDLQRRVHELEKTVQLLSGQSRASSIGSNPQQNGFPTQAYFLDAQVWSARKLFTSITPVLANDEMQTVLAKSNFDDIKAGYFSSVHAWMPIISKIKLERALHGLNSSLHADAALLLLCMKLVQTSPGPDKQTPHSLALYTIAKRFSKTLELDNVLTLRSIQAGILLTLYELGHGIFPAAYLSIAQCARQGVALGLHNKNAPQFLREPRSWADWEERQRVWWAIVILDRYIALGGEYRPLCTEDPERDTLLPANDSAWNNGEMVPPDRVSLSSQTTNTLGSFARLAQVANLLGRVIRHCNDTPLDISFTLDDFDTLIQALYSLLEMLPADHQASDDPTLARAICYSALFKLADHHTCNLFETDGQVLDEAIAPRARESMHKAFDVIRDTCGRVTILAQQIRNDLDLHLTSPRPHSSSHESTQRVVETASPLLCECLYTAAQNLLWMSLETNNPELGGWKGVCEEVLQGLDIRWGVAGAYLELLRVSEAGDEE